MTDQQNDEPDGNELAGLVGPLWSEAKVCSTLGIDTETLTSLLEAGTVLGLTTSDGVRFYPISQFHHQNDTVEVKPALLPFLRALRGFDPWTVAVLAHTPASELDDMTPLDWVRLGGSPEVLTDFAHTVAREWNAGTPVI